MQNSSVNQVNSNSRCQGQTKSGNPCGAAASEGGLCYFHANPEKAAELGRVGGRRNARVLLDLDPLPDLDNAASVRDAIKRLVSDVYARKLNPRVASGLGSLLQLQLRAIETAALEERLANSERRLEGLKAALTKKNEEIERLKRQNPTTGRNPSEAVKPNGSGDTKTNGQS